MILLKKIKNKIQSFFSKTVIYIYIYIMRKRLKNKNFSIVCSNCMGGLIYHRLNQKFMSPTINLWLHQPDFLKFVTNLKYYISQELAFVESEYNYPVGKLDDITIHFNHSIDELQAYTDWNRRKKRINYDNLYIIMYDRDGITKNDILKLKDINCKNLIVFSHNKYPDIDYVKTIKPTGNPDGSQYLDHDWIGFRTFEKHFDYVKWLNKR